MIEAGQAPLRRLRYRLARGQRERIALSTRTKVAFAIGRQAPSSPPAPALKLTASVEIREVGANGVASRVLHIDSIVPEGTAALEPGVKEDLDAVLDKLRAFESQDELDDRGIQRSRTLAQRGDDPEAQALMETLLQAFGHMSAPLPLEPVGVGARWEVESELAQQGISLKQLTTYELMSLDGDAGRLSLSLTQRAPGGKVSGVKLPFQQAEIVRLHASGDGELRFDLARTMPSGHIESTSSVLLRTRQQGNPQDVSVDTSTQVRFDAVR